MTDSTARAARFESDSSPAPAFLWAPPQKPITVSLPLAMIDKLEREAVESFRSLSSRGSEIGGILFGSFAPGEPLAVSVVDFEPVPCEYARGPLYRLTDVELARIDRAIEQRLASGVRAVGFYRSHTRKGLGLDADDLAVLDSRFREAHQIALLIRPNATKASMAGIFFRENGAIHTEASCLEFPFRSAPQDGAKRDEGLYDGAVAGPRSVTAAPAAARPAPRAQIVPIASRREVAPDAALPTAVPEPEPQAAAPAERPAPPAPAAPPAPPAAETKAPAPPPAPKVEPPPAPAKAAAPEPEPELEPAAKPRSGKLLWIVLGTAVTLTLGAGLLVTSGVLRFGNRAANVAPQDSSPLALRVDRNGGDIVLTWNRESPVIRGASRAVLQISDGPQHENVDMDLAQLKNGSIVYSPVTSDVVFKMEVTGSDQMKTTSESVRVLRTRPSAMSDPAAQQAQPSAPSQPAAAPKADTSASSAESEPAPEENPKVKLAQAVKPFQKETLAQRLRASAPASTDLPEAPMLGAPAPAAANVNLGNLVGQAAAPAPAPSAAQPSAPKSAPKLNVGGQVQQAQIQKRRDPEYPKLARDSGASGIVELIATIKPDGRVGEVKVVRGHPLLRQAASDAVKSWIYKPAILNGVPIETQTQVLLNFQPR